MVVRTTRSDKEIRERIVYLIHNGAGRGELTVYRVWELQWVLGEQGEVLTVPLEKKRKKKR